MPDIEAKLSHTITIDRHVILHLSYRPNRQKSSQFGIMAVIVRKGLRWHWKEDGSWFLNKIYSTAYEN